MKTRNDIKVEFIINVNAVQPVVISKGSLLSKVKFQVLELYKKISQKGDGNYSYGDDNADGWLKVRLTNTGTGAIDEYCPSTYAVTNGYLSNNFGTRIEKTDRGVTTWGPRFGTGDFTALLELYPGWKEQLIKDEAFYGLNARWHQRLIECGYVVKLDTKIIIKRYNGVDEIDDYALTEKGKNYVLDQFITGMRFIKKRDRYEKRLKFMYDDIDKRSMELKKNKEVK